MPLLLVDPEPQTIVMVALSVPVTPGAADPVVAWLRSRRVA